MWEQHNQQYEVAFIVLSSVGGSAVGPIIGGFIQTYCNWHWNVSRYSWHANMHLANAIHSSGSNSSVVVLFNLRTSGSPRRARQSS